MRAALLVAAFASSAVADLATDLFQSGKEYVYGYSASLMAGSNDYVSFASAINFTGELHIQGGASVLNVQLNNVQLGLYSGEWDMARSLSGREQPFQLTATLGEEDAAQVAALDDDNFDAQLVMPDLDNFITSPLANVKLSTSLRRDKRSQVQVTASISKADADRVTSRQMIGELSFAGLGSLLKLNHIRPGFVENKSYLGQGDKVKMAVGLSAVDAALVSATTLLDGTGRLRLRWAGGAFDAPFKAGKLVRV